MRYFDTIKNVLRNAPEGQSANAIWLLIGSLATVGTAMIIASSLYNLREAVMLGGTVVFCGIIAALMRKNGLLALQIVIALLTAYQLYILDLSRFQPNIGVVWFLLFASWSALIGRLRDLVVWTSIGFAAIWFTSYRAPANDPLWNHPLTEANLYGVLILQTFAVLLVQVNRNRRENKLSDTIKKAEALADELRRANERLALSERSKSSLLTTMSHELRTPMMSIVTAANMLKSSSLTAEDRWVVRSITRAAENIVTLMNDVLTLGRIEAGHAVAKCEPFNVLESLEGTIELIRVSAKSERHTIDIHPETPSIWVGDEARLRQVVLNLVRNALKHSGTDEVLLSIRPHGDRKLIFDVVDFGTGMEPAELGTIFEPYVKLGQSENSTGLGLTIAREFVQLMGGELSASSILGEGTRFTFTISGEAGSGDRLGNILKRPNMRSVRIKNGTISGQMAVRRWLDWWEISEEPDAKVLDLNRKNSGKFSVQSVRRLQLMGETPLEVPNKTETNKRSRQAQCGLIVEDDELLSKLLSRYFEKAGYQMSAVHNCSDALSHVQRFAVDFAFVDINIPGGTGLDVIARLAQKNDGSVIYALSGLTDYQSDALKAGATRFFAKPVELSTLHGEMSAALEEAAGSQDTIPPI